MFFNKKGQTATEYLIILAVVIVVALIVVGVMGGIPGIGTGVSKKAAASYWKSTDVAIDSYAIASDGAITLNVRNNMDTAVDISELNISTFTMTTGTGVLTPGQTGTLTGTTGAACTGSFSYDVSITYTDQATNAEYTFTGDGHKLEGTCAN
jgi:uncharacterized protein (UPF0333 family)